MMNSINNYYNVTYFVIAAQGYIQCKYSDPGFDECLRDAAQKAIPHLANGKNIKSYLYHNYTFVMLFILTISPLLFLKIFRYSEFKNDPSGSTAHHKIRN